MYFENNLLFYIDLMYDYGCLKLPNLPGISPFDLTGGRMLYECHRN